ncbi:LacI family DNA-binding transcriptional regulator [Changpingibacter yushuensis]|uniref:LacI family DNA-binding transcriptional regulator n=1 Tax=Changpingibacter yushuensis TaxID=2758440 RepID=UPI0015F7415A|nr:LacI family DNA-binding transcriptional regulator [Changpingibacter yushuensis]
MPRSEDAVGGVIGVAKLAGVSPSTVSRVLSGSTNVKAATRVKVENAIDELGYQPNRFAQALITHKSGIIGVMVDDSIRYATSNVLVQIESHASRMGYVTVVQTISFPFAGKVAEIMGRFESVMIEGLIVIAPRAGLSNILQPYATQLPMVLITTEETTSIPTVCEDQYQGTRQLMKMLYDAGHRSIWHVAGSQDWFDEQVRRRAWEDFVAEEELSDNSRLIQCTWDAQSAYDAILVEDMSNRPDAIFAASDNLAVAVLAALRVRGLKVPWDVAIVGFDDNDFSAYVAPGFTTVVQDLSRVAQECVRILLMRIDGQQVARKTLLGTTVRVRGSHISAA